jgi:hypothetical protein
MASKVKALLLPLVAASALAAVIGAAAASSGTTSVTITTPAAGSTVVLHKNPYTAVAGGVSFAAADPQTTRFYLRRDGCGTSNDNPHLSTTSGTDGGDGCGLVVNAVAGVGGDADQAAFIDFPATDGMPLAFDAGRNITGAIDLQGLGLGVAEVDVSMEALVGGQGVTVGSDTETAVLDPTASDNSIPFTIRPAASLGGADFQGVDLRVHLHGPYLYSGFIGLSGKSWADLPSFSASVNRSVQISVDDASFANPIPARIEPSGSSWSVAVPTPAPGRHTIYAESAQGFDVSAPASTTFTVKR